jgi:hypothetical protein
MKFFATICSQKENSVVGRKLCRLDRLRFQLEQTALELQPIYETYDADNAWQPSRRCNPVE